MVTLETYINCPKCGEWLAIFSRNITNVHHNCPSDYDRHKSNDTITLIAHKASEIEDQFKVDAVNEDFKRKKWKQNNQCNPWKRY